MTDTLLETEHYRVIDTRHGRMMVNPKDTVIGRSLIEYGEYSELEWQLIKRFLRPGAVAVDVGANIGALTVPMAKTVGNDGWVYAFEAQPQLAQILGTNLILNDITRAQVFNVACTATTGRASLVMPDPAIERHFGGLSVAQMSGSGPLRIRRERLDNLIDPPRLSFVKIDANGMEGEVIEGGRGLISTHRPVVYVENEQPGRSAGLIRQLAAMGYNSYWHAPAFYNGDNFAKNADNQFPNTVSMNMLSLPEEMKANLKGFARANPDQPHPLEIARQKQAEAKAAADEQA